MGMKKILALSLMVSLAIITVLTVVFCVPANAATSGVYTYEVSNGEVTITDCLSTANGIIIIPSVIGGYPVTKIGEDAFCNCTKLTEVIIPDSVTSIGGDAFYGCTNLTSVIIPNSVTSISYCAFWGCIGLTSIEIPDSVTSIGSSVFRGCTGLTSVTIGDGVTSIGAYVFEGCTGLTNIEIPDSVTSVSGFAFCGCTSLTSVIIPNSVTSIGYGAFSGCTGLTSIKIPDSVTSIDDQAFWGCSSLESITLPFVGNNATENGRFHVIFGNESDVPSSLKTVILSDACTTIGSYAFLRCTRLASVIIGNGVTSIGYGAFSGCTGLTNITISESITSIGASAFAGCDALQYAEYGNCKYLGNADNPYLMLIAVVKNNYSSYTIHDDTIVIVQQAFAGCVRATEIAIPNSVTTIGYQAFYECVSLTSVAIGDGVTSIGDEAFWGCTGLTSIEIPDSITRIRTDAFYGCKKLTSVYITDLENWCHIQFSTSYSNPLRYGATLHINREPITDLVIPGSVTSISEYAFVGCTRLSSITLPDSITSIGGGAFSACTGLTSIKIPDSVITIGPSAFSGCTGLTSVTIGDGITVIREFTFNKCTGLTSLSIGNGVTYIHNGAFWGCTGLTSIEIPNSVTGIGVAAFTDCTGLTSVTIGDGVTNIDDQAFWGCTGLTHLTIPDSVTSIGEKAFWNCTGLTSVTIGDSVTSIDDRAFGNCTRLTSITFRGNTPTCGPFIFHNVVATLYYPASNKTWTINNIEHGGRITWVSYCVHEWQGATCTAPKICVLCGETEGDVLEHNYQDRVVTVANCTEQGYTTYTCDSCGESYKDNYVDAIGHKDANRDHICDNGCGIYQGVHADGSDADHKCDYGCGQDNMTAHNYAAKVVAPTCESKGYTIHTCACGDSFTDSEVAATGHKDANRDHICDNGCGMYQGAHSDGNDADHLCDYGCGTTASEHAYQSIVTSPTCTEKGYTTHICACGHSYVDAEKNALGHNYAAWYETVAPTCTTEGTQRHDCSRCDHYETQAISAKGHNYQTIVTVPTCTDRGYTTHTCACGDRYVDSYVAATGHKDNNRDHICDNACGIYQGVHADGNDADHKCDYGCGEDHMTDHSYSAVVTAPTCENKGFTTYTCVCGDTYTANEVAAKGHTEVIDAAIAATCTKTGMTEGKHCSVCKKILVAQKTTQALGHKPGANATCTTAQSCTVCHTELVAAKGHKDQNSDYVCDTCNAKLCVNHVTEVVPAKEATCEQNGLTAGKKCSLCEEILEQQEIIPAKGHNYTDVIAEPLCTERGYTTHTCHCGDKYVDNYVAALGHKDDDKDHVCENGCGIYQGTHADGNDADHKCDYGCGTDNMTDHQYDAVVTAPDCTNQGYTTHSCVCGHTYTDSYVAALDHEWDDATCEHVETCQNCGATRGQLTDHNFGEWIEVQSPTVDAYGTAERMCKTCGKTEQKQLDKLQVQPTVPTEPSNPQDTKPTEPTEPGHTQGTKPTAPTQTGNPQGSKDAGENDDASIVMVIVLAALCAAAGVATGVVIAKKKQ